MPRVHGDCMFRRNEWLRDDKFHTLVACDRTITDIISCDVQ